MIAELGNYALALSLAVSFFLAIFPLWGAEKGHPQLMSLARPMTYGLFFSLTIAFAALFYLFAVNDFSVQYVVNNSNSSLPIYYRLSAVWGSHEGSLLLWIWLLTLWGAAVALFSNHFAYIELLYMILSRTATDSFTLNVRKQLLPRD